MSANTDWVVDIVVPKELRVRIQAVTSDEAEEKVREQYNVIHLTQVQHWSHVDPGYEEE